MKRLLAALLVCALLLLPVPAHADGGRVTLTGLDAHDGTITQDPDTGYLYLYGTRYGCGFQWGSASPWCGFGVWKSTQGIEGPWVFQRLLFSPDAYNSWAQRSWTALCGTTGSGCFNPRMVRRTTDGVWILAFNAPNDYTRVRANAYYFMGCAGPAGPCGPYPGVENGSMNKPRLWGCAANGDFSIFDDGAGSAYMVCTLPGGSKQMTFSIERLDKWWTNAVQGAYATKVAGLSWVESPAMIRVDGTYHLLFGSPNCGYCAAGLGSATASSPLGDYERGPELMPISETGGQPRSVFMVDGEPWLWVDGWANGERNQTAAPVILVPLTATSSSVSAN